jgi:hypothetical protein
MVYLMPWENRPMGLLATGGDKGRKFLKIVYKNRR